MGDADSEAMGLQPAFSRTGGFGRGVNFVAAGSSSRGTEIWRMEGVPIEVSVAGEMPPLVCVVAILAAMGTGAEGEALVLVVVVTIMVVSSACRRAVWRRGRIRSSSCAGIEGLKMVRKRRKW
jgi:hypothetical protein